jgi:hypothetical protein
VQNNFHHDDVSITLISYLACSITFWSGHYNFKSIELYRMNILLCYFVEGFIGEEFLKCNVLIKNPFFFFRVIAHCCGEVHYHCSLHLQKKVTLQLFWLMC